MEFWYSLEQLQKLIVFLIYVQPAKEHKKSSLCVCLNIDFCVGVILLSDRETNLKNPFLLYVGN